jgi:hypothetical protein
MRHGRFECFFNENTLLRVHHLVVALVQAPVHFQVLDIPL